uniref:Cyclic nucleotide-binding domain-containing protein n=1 Tax=Chlamydomonas euryale TaxID=1486919 RepID=A0A7R9VK40_9CHLO|mmetsp:Transcript_37681/g.111524  ORF Transcript_37681/g.111524 Transcript_37681/m.111524 type:complete len:1159 (+) Transcript_37681:435-3911(+)
MPPQEAEDAGVGGDSVGDGGGSWYRGGNNGAEEAGTSGRDDGDADDLQVASPAGRAASRPGALRRPSAEFGARGRVRRTSIDSILKVGGAAEYGDSPRVRPGRRVSVNPAGMEGGDVTDSPRLRPAGRRVSMHVPESEQMAFDGRMAESSGVLVENSGGSAPHGSPRVRPGDDRVATQTLMLVPGQAMSGHESLPHTPNGWAPMRDFVLKAGLGSQDMSSAQGMSKNGSVELPGGIMTRIDSMVSGMGSDAGTGKRHSIYDAAPKSAKEDGGTGKKKLKIVMSSLIKVDDQPRQWWQPRVILPTERWYNIFWYMCMTLALLNAVLDPYKLAFEDPSGFNPYNDFFTIIEYISILVFAIDIVLKFFVAYEDEEQRTFVTDLGEIRVAFLRMMFWLDLLFWFPFASVINQALGPNAPYSTQMYVMLLSWLKCGRLYRVFIMFAHLDHSMIISQISLMLVRNFFYILATCHWFACIIYFIGKAEVVGGMDSWLSRPVAAARFEGFPPIVAYVNTIYLSINLFAGLGDADFYVATWIEALVTSAYLLFNVVLGAYILGTVTMLMVKGDERIKAYRDRVVTLKEYVSMNDLPGQLHSAMKQHLELHFHSEQTSDERVLKDYPRPIRRRVLRHLYLQSIYQCYVMRGCKPKFLDALLSACSTDLFMPDVQLIADGDVVSELLVIIEGEVDVVRVARESSVAGSNATTLGGKLGSTLSSGDGEDHSRRMSMASLTGSMNAGSMGQRSLGGGQSAGRERRGESQPVGEIAFFTERPSSEAVWTCSVVRMLVLSKAAFDSLSATYASQVRTVLTNMRDQTERLAIHELNEALDELPHVEGSLHEQLKEYITHGVGLVTADLPEPQLSELKSLLDSKQQHRISDLDAMNEAFDRLCEKQDKQRLFDMFSAASAGENDLLLQMLKQGVDVNAVDEAGRTVLMVAAHAGRADIVELLLALEASPELSDGDGHSALSLALLNGHADVARMLKDAGASLAHSNHVILPAIIACIVGGNTTLLTHLLQAGADVGMVDFAHRSLLHIAAIAGDAAAAAALLDAGAPVLLTDSWGSTPLETAEARQHEAVAALLRPAVAAARARGQRANHAACAVWRATAKRRSLRRRRRLPSVRRGGPHRGAGSQRPHSYHLGTSHEKGASGTIGTGGGCCSKR